jgi:hypothetical protein
MFNTNTTRKRAKKSRNATNVNTKKRLSAAWKKRVAKKNATRLVAKRERLAVVRKPAKRLAPKSVNAKRAAKRSVPAKSANAKSAPKAITTKVITPKVTTTRVITTKVTNINNSF